MEDKVTWHFGHISAEPGSNRALQLMQRATGSAPATHWVEPGWGELAPDEVMVFPRKFVRGSGQGFPPAARPSASAFRRQKQRSKPAHPVPGTPLLNLAAS